MASCGNKLRINDGGKKYFRNNILKKYFQNTILFCILKILLKSILPITDDFL